MSPISGVDAEFDQAMEAMAQYEMRASLKNSDELVCECHPVSYRQIAEYVNEDENQNECVPDILNALCIAQGCGTCLDKASYFVKMLRRGNEKATKHS